MQTFKIKMSKTRKSLRDEIEEVQNIVRNTVFQELKSRDRELEKLQNVSKELETFSKHFEKVKQFLQTYFVFLIGK